MSDRTAAVEGFEQLNWLIHRFNYDVEHALDTMVKNNQDMRFLTEYVMRVEGEKANEV